MTQENPIPAMGSQLDGPVYNEDGVDLSMIRWMLSLSLEERLQVLQDHANTLLMMKNEITIS